MLMVYDEINKSDVILTDANLKFEIIFKGINDCEDESLDIDKIYHDNNGNKYIITKIDYTDFKINVKPLRLV